MSWTLFIDESGQDRRSSPYEVLAGVAIEDFKLWRLIKALSQAQKRHFGINLFEAYENEAKATKLLKRKVFKHAAQLDLLPQEERTRLALEILQDGDRATRLNLTALAQAKLTYVHEALRLTREANAVAFASIVPQVAPRPRLDGLRKDYAYLFERFFHFLNTKEDRQMGYLVFDELDKSSCHLLLEQVSRYFTRTQNGRTRSRLIIPEPFFVHSDLTTMIQVADLIAYIISWGIRFQNMNEPSRQELRPFAEEVMRLRYTHRSQKGYDTFGFKLINDLRARNELQP
ncbi:DUF3800 domain-containing protein [Stappia indica]|uniref:DUF3800 domain-containing protein n=1 Tax=Stappia indica TaxID=538381 RepID=A0A857C7F7_9HYPH|nr:DUF3800 domain-containing protein [Stappia indica]QGZ34851.1 DUF3800 domain-containing protein [Stappia indica]